MALPQKQPPQTAQAAQGLATVPAGSLSPKAAHLLHSPTNVLAALGTLCCHTVLFSNHNNMSAWLGGDCDTNCTLTMQHEERRYNKVQWSAVEWTCSSRAGQSNSAVFSHLLASQTHCHIIKQIYRRDLRSITIICPSKAQQSITCFAENKQTSITLIAMHITKV